MRGQKRAHPQDNVFITKYPNWVGRQHADFELVKELWTELLKELLRVRNPVPKNAIFSEGR
jgi:hypothetical protein